MRAIPMWGRVALAALVFAVGVVAVVLLTSTGDAQHAVRTRSDATGTSVPVATTAARPSTTVPVPEPVATTEPPSAETTPLAPAPEPAPAVTETTKPVAGPPPIVVVPKTETLGAPCGSRGATGRLADGRTVTCGGPAGGPPIPLVWMLA